MKGNKGQFKPGTSGNPGGKPALPEDLKKLIKDTSFQIKRDICEIYSMDLKEFHAMKGQRTGISVGRAALIQAVNNTIEGGDLRGIQIVLDRVLGKIPEAKEESEEQNTVRTEVVNQLKALINDSNIKLD